MTSKVRRLGAAALAMGIAGQWERCGHYVERLAVECPDRLGEALLGWCDTYIDHAHAGLDPDPTGMVAMNFRFVDGGRVVGGPVEADSDAVPPEYLWAGRLITARTLMNEDTYLALVNTVPSELAEEHFKAVLITVALTMRMTPRGFAWHAQTD